MSKSTKPCVFCAFPIPLGASEPHKPDPENTPLCPVCLDGEEDPWSMIRAIRHEFGRLTEVLPSGRDSLPVTTPEIFESDRRVLLACLDVVWPGLRFSTADGPADPNDIAEALQRAFGYEERAARDQIDQFLRLHERFHNRWDVVKESVLRRWQQLSARDIDHVDGTVSGLAALLVERYALSVGEARAEVMTLLEDLHFPQLVRLSPKIHPLAKPATPSPEEHLDSG